MTALLKGERIAMGNGQYGQPLPISKQEVKAMRVMLYGNRK